MPGELFSSMPELFDIMVVITYGLYNILILQSNMKRGKWKRESMGDRTATDKTVGE